MITDVETVRMGNITQVTATSDLGAGVTFYWYIEGQYVGSSTSPRQTFQLDGSEQARVHVVDSLDANFDPAGNAPTGYPARRTLWWVRSLDADVDFYRIQQQRESDPWNTLGIVRQVFGQWTFSFTTDALDDLTNYNWRIVPVDVAGNEGTPIVIGAEMIVRTPDAPRFAVSFDSQSQKVTFSAA